MKWKENNVEEYDVSKICKLARSYREKLKILLFFSQHNDRFMYCFGVENVLLSNYLNLIIQFTIEYLRST
jgi:hypothetical protein